MYISGVDFFFFFLPYVHKTPQSGSSETYMRNKEAALNSSFESVRVQFSAAKYPDPHAKSRAQDRLWE